MSRKWLGIALISLWTAGCATTGSPPRNAELDRMLAQKHYDQIFSTLFVDIHGPVPKGPAQYQVQDTAWLQYRAHDADFPLSYYLSWELLNQGDLVQARNWNARGRVRMMLDAKVCTRQDPGQETWYMIMEGFHGVTLALRQDKLAWAHSVDHALGDVAQNYMRAPDMTWFCGTGNYDANLDPARNNFRMKIKTSNDAILTSARR